ncbi:winged helix-turn-helix transcriptional regulator [Candidatus Thorarchaeota archaeon]|nr:MAG: winged helix-turn-helix transcriptional regulator [Candidatus Thorarchaeota archaeon]
MDDLDKKILGDLGQNCRVSYQELSRRYGISANAIRRRVLNLEESGEISGYSLLLTAEMLGVHRILGILTSDGSRDEVAVMDEIGNHSGVIAAASYSNGTYALVGEYRTSEELLGLTSHFRRIDSIENSEIHQIIQGSGSPFELSKMHLRILKTLINEPKLSVVEISNKSGLTARRVRRLLSQLEESGAVQFRALLELGAATTIPFLARVTWDERKTNYQEVRDLISQTYPLSHWETYVSASEPVLYSLIAVEGLVEVNEVTSALRKHDKIESVKALISMFHKFYPSITRQTLLDMIKEVYPE